MLQSEKPANFLFCNRITNTCQSIFGPRAPCASNCRFGAHCDQGYCTGASEDFECVDNTECSDELVCVDPDGGDQKICYPRPPETPAHRTGQLRREEI